MAYEENKKEIVLGAGRVYVDRHDDNGNKTGEIYLGETPALTLNISTEQTDVYSADSPLAEKIKSITRSVVRMAAISCVHVSLDNLALFFLGREETASQVAVPVVNEAVTVQTGHWYQLGADTNVTGVRKVKNVVVTNSAGGVTYVKNDDYALDADLGRIFIIADGDIRDGDNIKVDYTPEALSFDRVVSSDEGAIRASLRFIADNTEGDNRDLYAPMVNIQPSGDLALKSRDTEIQISLQVEFLTEGDQAAVYIDNRPV